MRGGGASYTVTQPSPGSGSTSAASATDLKEEAMRAWQQALHQIQSQGLSSPVSTPVVGIMITDQITSTAGR
jgi:hypothetical protein